MTLETHNPLALVFSKLEAIESQLINQVIAIKHYIDARYISDYELPLKILDMNINANKDMDELLLASLKSTRTSFELMRDEIDELYQATIIMRKKDMCKDGA